MDQIPTDRDIFAQLSPDEITIFWAQFAHQITIAARATSRSSALAAFNEVLHRATSQICLRLSGQRGAFTEQEWLQNVLEEAPKAWNPHSTLQVALLLTKGPGECDSFSPPDEQCAV